MLAIDISQTKKNKTKREKVNRDMESKECSIKNGQTKTLHKKHWR